MNGDILLQGSPYNIGESGDALIGGLTPIKYMRLSSMEGE